MTLMHKRIRTYKCRPCNLLRDYRLSRAFSLQNQPQEYLRLLHSQASPHASSSSSASLLGSTSTLFATTTGVAAFDLAAGAAATFLTGTACPVELALAPRPGLTLLATVDLERPLGSGVFAFCFACVCALSQPAKSGSPLSSNDVVGAAGFDAVDVSADEEKGSREASSFHTSSPQAAPKSSARASSVGGGVEVVDGAKKLLDGGDLSDTWLRDAGRFVLEGAWRPTSADGGTDCGRASCCSTPLAVDDISPLAEPSLLVNDEMAQPAQEEASVCGVPMRGADAPVDDELLGGSAVSGKVWLYLRTRWR